jgi:hypothetical protein
VTNFILNSHLKTEQEKDLLVSTTSVKEFVRVPKIKEHNEAIKEEIIKRVEEMLELEERTLSDFVDFSGVLLQKFREVKVEKNYLVLIDGGEKRKFKIDGDPKLVEKALSRWHKNELPLDAEKIKLSELKSLPLIDFEREKKLKDYIDDLVFALYFNVTLGKIGLEKAKGIKEILGKNRFYKIL